MEIAVGYTPYFLVILSLFGDGREIGGKELRKFFFKLVFYLALSGTSFKLLTLFFPLHLAAALSVYLLL
jgi:hypothetical protein